jgi:hypothetical protein
VRRPLARAGRRAPRLAPRAHLDARAERVGGVEGEDEDVARRHVAMHQPRVRQRLHPRADLPQHRARVRDAQRVRRVRVEQALERAERRELGEEEVGRAVEADPLVLHQVRAPAEPHERGRLGLARAERALDHLGDRDGPAAERAGAHALGHAAAEAELTHRDLRARRHAEVRRPPLVDRVAQVEQRPERHVGERRARERARRAAREPLGDRRALVGAAVRAENRVDHQRMADGADEGGRDLVRELVHRRFALGRTNGPVWRQYGGTLILEHDFRIAIQSL